MKRAVKVLAVLVVAWIAVLFVCGFALAERTGRRVAERVGTSLQATATVRDTSLGLVGGSVEIDGLSVRRDDVLGTLELDVGHVDCDLAPLGIALVDRTCGELAVRDITMNVSSAALFKLEKPKRTPFQADEVVIDNAKLTFMPSAFLPSLGRVSIAIEHARAGATTFKTPLSFLFALRELKAAIELPAGVTLHVHYAGGTLRAKGSLLGSTPIELPLALPKLDSTDDARAEIAKLVAWGKDVAEKLVTHKAEDWIRKKLPLP